MGLLRRTFGPSREEIWRQFTAEIGGRYVGGNIWKGARVQASHGEWTVTLDTFTVMVGKVPVTYTRVRAPYVNPEGFRFTIARRHLFTPLAAWLGLQDIEIGDPQFDHDFVFKTTHPDRARALLASTRIRQLIAAQRECQLTVKDDEGWFGASFPDGVDELYFAVARVITDIDRLKGLYALFAETLDALTASGSAYARDPGVAL